VFAKAARMETAERCCQARGADQAGEVQTLAESGSKRTGEPQMTSNKLPSVLVAPRDSISMERALKQIKQLLEELFPVDEIPAPLEDRLNASLDDVDTMLECIDRN
jgi:hypothetical protein